MKTTSHSKLEDRILDYESLRRERPKVMVISRDKAIDKGMVTEVSKFVDIDSTRNKSLQFLDFALVNLLDAGVDMTPISGFGRSSFAVADSVELLNTHEL